MAYYAAAAIDDAIDATRARLFPVSGWLWARLAVITLLLGGGGFGGQLSNLQSVPTGGGPNPGPGPGVPSGPGTIDPGVGAAVIAVAVILLLVVVAVFALIGSTMQFVFVDALSVRDRSEVRVIGPFFDRLGAGFRLFLFNLGLFLLVAIPIAVVVIAVVGVFSVSVGDGGGGSAGAGVAVSLLLGLVVLLLALLVGVVSSLTTQFVVPVMITTGGTVLGSWRRLYPILRENLAQTGVYLLLRFLLGLGVGIVNLLLTVVAGLAVVLVAGVIAALFGGLALLVAGENAALLVGGGVGVIVGGVGLLVVSLVVSVLTKTYLRTYELSVLGRFDAAFELLPDYDDGDTDGPGGDDDTDGPGGDTGGGDPEPVGA